LTRNQYLSLGDSITCGIGATEKKLGYSSLVADILRLRAVCATTASVAGPTWTAQHLLRAVRSISEEVWQNTFVATVLIGGSDLRRRYYSFLSSPAPAREIQRAIDGCSHALSSILEIIRGHGVPHVLVLTLYNPFPHSQCAVSAVCNLNQRIFKVASQFDCQVVDLYPLFLDREAEWIARFRTGRIEDLSIPFGLPIHPNDAGHQAIAEAIIDKLLTVTAHTPSESRT
jgi:lysophospholipase L1-like esterase